MKTTFLSLAASIGLCLATSHSMANAGTPYVGEPTVYQTTAHTLVVGGGVKVVLVSTDAAIPSRESSPESVRVKQQGQQIKLSNRGSGNAVIYLRGDQLKYIQVLDGGSVESIAPLVSNHLLIHMEGDCRVNIKSTGRIDLVRSEFTQLQTLQQSGHVTVAD